MNNWLVRILLAWALLCGLAQAQQAVPALTGHVVDTASLLAPEARQSLESKLTAFEQAKGAQVVVLIVASTQPEDIASYANRIGNAWKIGRQGVGDGVLLVVAVSDRTLRIEVAKTLEGAIPDLAAKRIIDQAIRPAFRQGDYAGGLTAGTEQIMALIKGEALPEPAASARTSNAGFDWTELAVFLFFAVPILGTVVKGIFGTRLGSLLAGGAAGAVAYWVTTSLLITGVAAVAGLLFTLLSNSNPGRHGGLPGGPGGGFGGHHGGGGFGGGFGGGGGFSSGGGGDFGGGGASGGW